MTIPYVVQRAREFNNDGDPLNKGRISFYEPGSVGTLKDVFTDVTGTEKALNPHPLDAAGKVREGGVWLGTGRYKVITEKFIGRDNDGNPEYEVVDTMDNIPGAGSAVEGELNFVGLDTVQDLRDIDTSVYQLAYCANHSDPADNFGGINDFGGGWFEWDPNKTNPDDNGGYIAPTGSPAQGRWVRLIEGSRVAPEMWGALPNRNDLDVAGNINNMMSWMYGRPNPGFRVEWRSGTYYIGSDVILTGNEVDHTFNQNVKFRPSASASGNNSVVVGGKNTILHLGSEMTTGYTGPGNPATIFVSALPDAIAVSPELYGILGNGAAYTNEDLDILLGSSTATIVFGEGAGKHYGFGNTSELDWGNKRLEFRNGAFLECSGANTISNFVREHNDFIFYGDYTNIEFKNQRNEFQVSWFNITEREPNSSTGYQNIDNTKFFSMIQCVRRTSSSSTNEKVHLIWDSKILPETYSSDTINEIGFTESVPWLSSDMRRIQHTISGITVTANFFDATLANTTIPFGQILDVTGSKLKIRNNADPSVGGEFVARFRLLNEEIDIRWFGANAGAANSVGTTAEDANWFALKMAHLCALASMSASSNPASAKVVGGGFLYRLDTGVGTLEAMESADVTAGQVVVWKDLHLLMADNCAVKPLPSNPLVSAILAVQANLKLDNVRITNTGVISNNPAQKYALAVDGSLETVDSVLDSRPNQDNQLLWVSDTFTDATFVSRNTRFLTPDANGANDAIVVAAIDTVDVQGCEINGSNRIWNSGGVSKTIFNDNRVLCEEVTSEVSIEHQSTSYLEMNGNSFRFANFRVLSGSRTVNVVGNTFQTTDLFVQDPYDLLVEGNSFRASNVYSAGVRLETTQSNYIIVNTKISGNSFNNIDPAPGSPWETVVFQGTGTWNDQHNLKITDNVVGAGWVNIATEVSFGYTVDASALFTDPASGVYQRQSALINVPNQSVFPSIVGGQPYVLSSYGLDDVKVAGTYEGALGIGLAFGIDAVAFRRDAFQMKVFWNGPVPADTTQLVYLTIGV